jgi:hypothetical protein
MAWDQAVTTKALALYRSVAQEQLRAFGGYLVEASDGLMLVR